MSGDQKCFPSTNLVSPTLLERRAYLKLQAISLPSSSVATSNDQCEPHICMLHIFRQVPFAVISGCKTGRKASQMVVHAEMTLLLTLCADQLDSHAKATEA